MNIIAGIVSLILLIGIIVAAADVQNEEDKRLTKRFEE